MIFHNISMEFYFKTFYFPNIEYTYLYFYYKGNFPYLISFRIWNLNGRRSKSQKSWIRTLRITCIQRLYLSQIRNWMSCFRNLCTPSFRC